jgi:hypothetical protein
MRTRLVALVFGLAVGAAALRAASAQDKADDAFDSPAVKEIGARMDAMKVDDVVAVVKRARRTLDAKLLTVPESAWRGRENLRGRTDAGVARILQRGLFDDLVTPRGGGAYWSFTKRSNGYDQAPQIELQQGRFLTGFYGRNSGVVRRMGNGDLGALDAASLSEELLSPPDQLYARERSRTPPDRELNDVDHAAAVGGVYVVRALMWGECDVIAAFEVVSMDAYGATIAWRLLKTFDVPKLPQATPPRPGEGGLGGGKR